MHNEFKGTLTRVRSAKKIISTQKSAPNAADFALGLLWDSTPQQNPQQLMQIFPLRFYSADLQRVNIPEEVFPE